jgi:hypothetical protein
MTNRKICSRSIELRRGARSLLEGLDCHAEARRRPASLAALSGMKPSLPKRVSGFRCRTSAVFSRMTFRFSGATLAICFLVVGCAVNPRESAKEAAMWRAQLERQQQAVRDSGRIGHIGYEGPPSN